MAVLHILGEEETAPHFDGGGEEEAVPPRINRSHMERTGILDVGRSQRAVTEGSKLIYNGKRSCRAIELFLSQKHVSKFVEHLKV
jgi:hypothetical protein